jgi:transposase
VSYRHEGYARRFWLGWYRRAMRSRIEPLKAFARKLRGYLPGLLAHCRYPLHTSVLEGINNKIKVIKRMAYGFRDDQYFFLKIRAAFPGIGLKNQKKEGPANGAFQHTSALRKTIVRLRLPAIASSWATSPRRCRARCHSSQRYRPW